MSVPTFGMTFSRRDFEPRPVIAADMSTVYIIGTAPDADAAVFPVDSLVLMSSNDPVKLAALGSTGTLPDAVRGINDQLGDFQVAARIVVQRVTEGLSDDETIANIIGDQAQQTGLHVVLSAGATLGVVPRLLLAPGYTHQRAPGQANAVCAALPAICSRLLAHAIVEGSGTTRQDAIDWRETMNDERLIPVDAWVKVQEGAAVVSRPGAPRIAGIAVRRDYEKRGVPGHSWANQPVQGIVGFVRNVNFSLTDGATEGQELLAANIGIGVRGEIGVDTALSSSGFLFVGTDNASDDPLWQFYNVTRLRDYIHLGIMRASRSFLGRYNIEGQTVQAVLNTANFWLRDLKADNHILGGGVGFERDANSPENLRLGRFRYFFRAEEAPVLRRIDIDSMRDREALTELIDQLVQQANDLVA